MQKKTILITGATSGIGRAAAESLAQAGHDVIASGRKQGVLDELKAHVGTNIRTVILDVTDTASIAKAHEDVLEMTDGEGVDVLINNAGYGLAGPLDQLTEEDLRAQFETNVFGLMATTKAFLPEMRDRGEGRILNVSSVGGRVTFPFLGAYHGTKYAVEAFSERTEAHENRADEIRQQHFIGLVVMVGGVFLASVAWAWKPKTTTVGSE